MFLIVQMQLIYFRSHTFHNFIKVALTKNPKKRPPADKLLEVSPHGIVYEEVLHRDSLMMNLV